MTLQRQHEQARAMDAESAIRKDERRKVWRDVAALAALRRDCYRENDPAWTDLNSIVQEALKNAKE